MDSLNSLAYYLIKLYLDVFLVYVKGRWGRCFGLFISISVAVFEVSHDDFKYNSLVGTVFVESSAEDVEVGKIICTLSDLYKPQGCRL
ncbi:MAG: hypothetical protein ACTJLM_02125 [Ehrlichia sp.]